MIVLYFAVLAVLVQPIVHILPRRPRQVILIGVVFTSFTLGALPWHLFPISGVAFGSQLFFIAAAFLHWVFQASRVSEQRVSIDRYTLALLVLWLVVAGYVLPSAAPEYGVSKTVFFFVKGILPLLALRALAPLSMRDRQIVFWTIVAGSVLTALNMIVFGEPTAERATVGQELNPITVARAIGLGATLLGLALLLERRVRLTRVVVFGLLLVLLLTGMALTGSRGPLFAMAGAILAGGFLLHSRARMQLRALGRMAVVGAVAALLVLSVSARIEGYASIQRLANRIVNFGQARTDRLRIERYVTAWEGLLASRGLGIGTGGFASLYAQGAREYPHNVFLEVALEQGVIGLYVLAWVVSATLRRMSSHPQLEAISQGSYVKCLWGLFLYALLNAMVSGDMAANYLLWLSGGLIWIPYARPRQDTA